MEEEKIVYSDEKGGELPQNMTQETLVQLGYIDIDEIEEG